MRQLHRKVLPPIHHCHPNFHPATYVDLDDDGDAACEASVFLLNPRPNHRSQTNGSVAVPSPKPLTTIQVESVPLYRPRLSKRLALLLSGWMNCLAHLAPDLVFFDVVSISQANVQWTA
jgi:hypothetical protein